MSDAMKRGFADSPSTSSGAAVVEACELISVNLIVNDQPQTIMVEPRMTLLDVLRKELGLTGTKKSCDRGECGACTVIVDGRRLLSCMTLAAMQDASTSPPSKAWNGMANSTHYRQRSSSMTDSNAGSARRGKSCRVLL
jgi:ferredoxin